MSFFKRKYSTLKRRYSDTMKFFYSALNILYNDYLTNPDVLSEINKVKASIFARCKKKCQTTFTVVLKPSSVEKILRFSVRRTKTT